MPKNIPYGKPQPNAAGVTQVTGLEGFGEPVTIKQDVPGSLGREERMTSKPINPDMYGKRDVV